MYVNPQTSFEIHVSSDGLRTAQATADILTANYADEDLDIACSAFDDLHMESSCSSGCRIHRENWPLITDRMQKLWLPKTSSTNTTMSIYKDTRLLAEKAVTMVDAVLKGEEPEINILSSMITKNGTHLYVTRSESVQHKNLVQWSRANCMSYSIHGRTSGEVICTKGQHNSEDA